MISCRTYSVSLSCPIEFKNNGDLVLTKVISISWKLLGCCFFPSLHRTFVHVYKRMRKTTSKFLCASHLILKLSYAIDSVTPRQEFLLERSTWIVSLRWEECFFLSFSFHLLRMLNIGVYCFNRFFCFVYSVGRSFDRSIDRWLVLLLIIIFRVVSRYILMQSIWFLPRVYSECLQYDAHCIIIILHMRFLLLSVFPRVNLISLSVRSHRTVCLFCTEMSHTLRAIATNG